MVTKETYQAYFQKLNRFAEFLRLIINEYRDALPAPPPELAEERKKLLELFREEKVKSLCGSCGQCCYQGSSPLKTSHLIRLFLENPSLALPQPDYEFLGVDTHQSLGPKSKNRNFFESDGYKCVFLGPTGCRLKENRPRTCYRFTCGALHSLTDGRAESITDSFTGTGANGKKFPDLHYDWESAVLVALKKIMAEVRERLTNQQSQFLENFSQEEKRQFLLAIMLFIHPPGAYRSTDLDLGFDKDMSTEFRLFPEGHIAHSERWIHRCEEEDRARPV